MLPQGKATGEKTAYPLATRNLLSPREFGPIRIVISLLKFTTIEFKVKNFAFICLELHAQRNCNYCINLKARDYPRSGIYRDILKLPRSSHTVLLFKKLEDKTMFQNLAKQH